MTTKTCMITSSAFTAGEDGAPDQWALRVDVSVGNNRYSTTHVLEGPEDWTEADLTAQVLSLY